jgi:hypothetical protein
MMASVAGQITRKLDYEKGKRRDGALSPDYRERFAEDSTRNDRGGDDDRQFRILKGGGIPIGGIRYVFGEFKKTATIVFASKIKSLPLKLGPYIFSFKHSPGDFAKANGLPLSAAERILPQLREEANELLQWTKRRMLAAEPRRRSVRSPNSAYSHGEWYLTFRTFLVPVEPQPWSSFFKRLRLDPREDEPKEYAEAEQG